MASPHQSFQYSPSERWTRVGLFVFAFLLPGLIELFGFALLVIFPPHHSLNKELFVRVLEFYPTIAHRNHIWVPIVGSGLWVLAIVATLPNAISHSLVIGIDDDGITATLYGIRWKHIRWRDVARIERFEIREHNGLAWRSIGAVRLVSQKSRMTIRQTISESPELFRLIALYSEPYGVLIESARGK